MNFNASQAIHDQPQQQPQHRPPQPRQSANPASPGNSPQLQQQQQHIAQLQQQQQQQQQPHPQGHVAMNGMNGAGMPGGGGMSMPTPAGHQAELNYIYSMVEELSKQLADNRKVTEDIVNGLGKVRTKAKTNGISNGELLDAAADELQGQEENLDAQISLLTESLEKAKHSRDQNATLLTQYANALAVMLKQFHEYKTKHVADVAAWHRSYRTQLDEARRENSRLREQIWEMQTHAATANESLRKFRSKYDEDEKRWDGRVASVAAKQEIRFWKRMAMPELEDDDTYWSGDDDLIDPAEKERLRELEHRAAQEQMMAESQAEDSDGGPQQSPFQHMGVMGGIAMQREDTSLQPVPPPRPLSAASSTGSTGH